MNRMPAPILATLLLGAILAGCDPSDRPRTAAGVDRRESRAPAAAATEGPFVRVVGTVQDGGLPHVACDCSRCVAARRDPQRRRLVTSLALVLPVSQQVFLFDAAPDLRTQIDRLANVRRAPADRVDRMPVDGIFLTHAHIGHYLGLAFFGYEAVHAAGIPVFATSRMATFLRSSGPWSQLIELDNILLEELVPGQEHSLDGGVTVTALAAPHREEFADTVGFLIAGPHRRLFYLPDTDSWEQWPIAIGELLRQVDVALLDGTFFSIDELPGRDIGDIGHPLIPHTMDRLQGLVDRGAVEVYFTHLNHSNAALDDDSEARRELEARGFGVAHEGQEFPL